MLQVNGLPAININTVHLAGKGVSDLRYKHLSEYFLAIMSTAGNFQAPRSRTSISSTTVGISHSNCVV